MARRRRSRADAPTSRTRVWLPVIVGGACALQLSGRAAGQVAEGRDALGLSLSYRLVHLQHTTDPKLPGGTAGLRANQPFLFYQLGRDLANRQYRLDQGAYGRPGGQDIPLYTAAASGGPRFSRDHAASCGMCHTRPYREPGAGLTIASVSNTGRNTPHFFGGGAIEQIGELVRDQILARCDLDGDHVLDRREVKRAECHARVQLAGSGAFVDYGRPSPDALGVPRLNGVFRVWYVDRHGKVIANACGFDDKRVAALGFVMEPFGWGRGTQPCGKRRVAQGGEASTLREFFVTAADAHMGLQASEGTQLDLDRDGISDELTAGDLDAIEFYMLHAPEPAVVHSPGGEAGRARLASSGCTSCHVETWSLPRDRRQFRLVATGRRGDHRDQLSARLERSGNPRIDFIYSDFKHWDIGPSFHERRFDGSVQREHRTAPLWGVASSAPYGHSGAFPTLDSVIRAHAGEASAARDAYLALDENQRGEVLRWLSSLVLFETDLVPADIDGDAAVSPAFHVRGVDVGYERFDARFLFETPITFSNAGSVTSPEGRPWSLLTVTNGPEAFGMLLPYRRDDNDDGKPDKPVAE